MSTAVRIFIKDENNNIVEVKGETGIPVQFV